MVRVVFTVALLVAVAGVAVPAIEYAGVQRGDTAVRDAVDRLVAEARSLAAGSDALAPDAGPARRMVAVEFPTARFASAGVERFRVGRPVGTGATGGDVASGGRSEHAATRFTWRVDGGTEHSMVAEGIRIRPRPGDRIAVDGETQLLLTLVAVDGRTVVRLR